MLMVVSYSDFYISLICIYPIRYIIIYPMDCISVESTNMLNPQYLGLLSNPCMGIPIQSYHLRLIIQYTLSYQLIPSLEYLLNE